MFCYQCEQTARDGDNIGCASAKGNCGKDEQTSDFEVNDLPLSLMVSWFEQKAAAVLLTLLALGIKGIHLGPTLPAFVTPAVLDTLIEAFDIRANSTPEADMAAALAA